VSRPFDPATDAMILLLRDRCVPWVVIARLLGRTGQNIRRRYDILGDFVPEQRHPRICLRCRGPFESWGKGNRLCELCREATDWCAER
jgi:hypothetical protein